MEIGGYIEFPHYDGQLLHDNGIALNSARNCLAYLIEAKRITKIVLPKFLCDSVYLICKKYNVKVRYYSITEKFRPEKLELENDEWLYLVNYYGQLGNQEISEYHQIFGRVVVDNVQAYFQEPVPGVDTIYTCRKFFGVPDGAFLYTETNISRPLIQDKSADRMKHLLGRYENTASDYYLAYTENEKALEHLPLRRMSKLTENLLRSMDYPRIRMMREENYLRLDKKFSSINKLNLKTPVGPFMYPLYLSNGYKIRKELQKRKIYIPTLWPDVFDICSDNELESDMAKNILPLPCDQRYQVDDMNWMGNMISNLIEEG